MTEIVASTESTIPSSAGPHIEVVVGSNGQISLGDWFWRARDDAAGEPEWLGCVTEIGSNYVFLREPDSKSGYHGERILLSDCGKLLRGERDIENVLKNRVTFHQAEAAEALAQVQAITARLGVSRQTKLTDGHEHGNAASRTLAVLAATSRVDDYKTDLVRAKEEELPALFEIIRKENEQVARWMSARVLPALAQAGALKATISDIDARIFSIGIYAGLMEDIALCCDGAPAAFHEKLHLLQHKHYMDEECLLNYRHGGMEFKNIEAFDAKLCRPENRDRLFPYPRTMLAMQVRRKSKDRDWGGSLRTALINIELDRADKWTYLYIRNGERVSRLSCDLAFDELIFPSREMMNLSEPMMMKVRTYGSVEELITVADFEQRVTARAERQAAAKAWDKANPNPRSQWSNPYREDGFCFRSDQWQPFNPSSVFFDDASREIQDRIQKYNRVALLIQGLFDRSDALHPHPPVRTWTADGFAAAVELVYTGTNALVNGEAPDFEAYRERCNASLSADSVVIGQERYWLVREAEKEGKRRDADWRNKSDYRPSTFQPYGNPGPGFIARVKTWKPRTKQAVFEWTRDRRKEDTWSGKYRGDAIKTTVTVPEAKLFNVSAYRPGDYKQFFADHRTRAQYLRWAPMLLSAEEYHAGNLPAR